MKYVAFSSQHYDFLDWITFGGQTIKSGDPVEQSRQIKYSYLIANSIMLHNVVNLSNVLAGMAKEGYIITKELLATLSPYISETKFGDLTDTMLI